MQRAAKESTSSEFKPPVRNIEIRPRLSQVLDYMHECKKHGRFSTDIEVINHEVACLSLSYRHDEALVVPLTYEDGNYWNENQEARMWLQYASLMSDPEVMKINQNIIGFDALFLLLRNNIHVDGPLGDTMLAHRILYPEFNRGLDFQASMHTREPYWKDEGKMWKNEGGDFETFWRYNGKDGCVALELWDVHEPELRRMGMWNRYEMHANLMKSIMLMTVDGLAIEKNMLTETKGGIQRQLDDLYKELDDVSDYSFNPLSPAQCKNYFYNHKGIHPYKSSTGSITTDDKAVTRIYRKTHLREAKLVQEIRNLSKLKGTYLDVETDSDGRLRCSWDPLGTWTGRLSSSKTIFGTGMNLQNLDPRFKRFIVADGD
jgi:DNA polymerase-1